MLAKIWNLDHQTNTSFCPFLYEHTHTVDLIPGASPSFLSAFIKYQNGKLEEGTRYAVFQRYFDEDGDYENEGFITFTTKDDGIPTATLVLSIVVGLLVVLIVVIVIVMWRRRLHPNGEFNFYICIQFKSYYTATLGEIDIDRLNGASHLIEVNIENWALIGTGWPLNRVRL